MGILISHPRHSAQMAKQADHLWEGIDASNIHLDILGDNASTSCFAIRQPVGKERGKEREIDPCRSIAEGAFVCAGRALGDFHTRKVRRDITGRTCESKSFAPRMSSKARWRSKPRRRPLDQHTLILASDTSDGWIS